MTPRPRLRGPGAMWTWGGCVIILLFLSAVTVGGIIGGVWFIFEAVF